MVLLLPLPQSFTFDATSQVRSGSFIPKKLPAQPLIDMTIGSQFDAGANSSLKKAKLINPISCTTLTKTEHIILLGKKSACQQIFSSAVNNFYLVLKIV